MHHRNHHPILLLLWWSAQQDQRSLEDYEQRPPATCHPITNTKCVGGSHCICHIQLSQIWHLPNPQTIHYILSSHHPQPTYIQLLTPNSSFSISSIFIECPTLSTFPNHIHMIQWTYIWLEMDDWSNPKKVSSAFNSDFPSHPTTHITHHLFQLSTSLTHISSNFYLHQLFWIKYFPKKLHFLPTTTIANDWRKTSMDKL